MPIDESLPTLKSVFFALNEDPYSFLNIFIKGTDLHELSYYFSNDAGVTFVEATLTFNATNTEATGTLTFNSSNKNGLVYLFQGYLATIDLIRISYN